MKFSEGHWWSAECLTACKTLAPAPDGPALFAAAAEFRQTAAWLAPIAAAEAAAPADAEAKGSLHQAGKATRCPEDTGCLVMVPLDWYSSLCCIAS